MSHATIDDVARLAGVSKSTVSRVINNNTGYMREATRKKVEDAIEMLNYRPSSLARSLVSQRSNTLAVMISDVGNPFYAEVLQGVEDVAMKHNYNTFLCNINYDLDRGQRLLNSLIDKQVDGVLLMSSSIDDLWINQLKKSDIPAVILDWEVKAKKHERLSSIEVDFTPGITEATHYLLESGHRNFVHVSGALHLKTSHSRRKAFLDALERSGYNNIKVDTIEGDLQIDGGRKALKQILEMSHLPTAIFAANDMMALGIITEAQAQNFHIPQQLSVIGLDDISLATQLHPHLSTVALPRYEIGQIAVEQFLSMWNDKKPLHQTVSTRLIVRESTASI